MTEVKKKSFRDISLDITEAEYRNDGKMHYSTLAKYERGGFKSILTLFDRIETPSLLLGSVCDTLLTGTQEEFDSLYLVADFPSCPDAIVNIVKNLFGTYGDLVVDLNDISNSTIIGITEQVKYQPNWKPETRAKVIKEKGAEYYKLLHLTEGKTLVSSEMYADALKMVSAFKTAPSTSFLLAPNDPFNPEIERFYQLKFAHSFEGIEYSCMADLIFVNYEKKYVLPVDIKTSSHYEYDFFESFIDWSYQIQARSYWRQIRATMDDDEYFKDFDLKNYHFIVVNKHTLTPLVWECPFTKEYGSIFLGKNKQIELRDPFIIAKELKYYLESHSSVPIGINIDKPNNLEEWLNKL